MTGTDDSFGCQTDHETNNLEEIFMDKDKIFTWIMVAALFGSAVRMVHELQTHSNRKELIGDAEVIDDSRK